MVKDGLGNELQVGDVIFYGTRRGNSVYSHPGVIENITGEGPVGGRINYTITTVMWAEEWVYRPNGQSGWEKRLRKGRFESPENSIKVPVDYYNDEIRGLLVAAKVGR